MIGKKDGTENYRSVILSAVPGKFMELVLLEAISNHVKDKKVTG